MAKQFRGAIEVLKEIILGIGEGTASFVVGKLRGPAGVGSNIVGPDVIYEPGNGTGSGGSGAHRFRTSAPRPAVALKSTASTNPDSQNLTWNQTSADDAYTMLVVGVTLRGGKTVTGITYGGVALTFIRRDAPGTDVGTELWYLNFPKSGVNAVVVTASASCTMVAGAMTLTNCGGIGAHSGDTGTNTTSTTTVAASGRNRVVDAIGFQSAIGAPTFGSGQVDTQTKIGTAATFGMSTKIGSTSTNMTETFTSTPYAHSCVVILPYWSTAANFSGNDTDADDLSDLIVLNPDRSVTLSGSLAITKKITAYNLSGTNTGDDPLALHTVAVDSTLTGDGTSGNPLHAVASTPSTTLTGDATGTGTGTIATTVVQASGQWATPGVISPASLTADENDYNPTGLSTASVIRQNLTGGNFTITGLAGGTTGRRITIVNTSSRALTLANQGAASTATNRFTFYGGTDYVINSGCSIDLFYDGTTSRWRTTTAIQVTTIDKSIPVDGDQIQIADSEGSLFPKYTTSLEFWTNYLLPKSNALFLPLDGGTLTGNLLFSADNTKDIGASAATRPRTGYFGTSLISPVGTFATKVTTPLIDTASGPLNFSPTTNLTLTQNSVVPFTSEGAGAVANTLYLKTGFVGIGTNAPTVGLDVRGQILQSLTLSNVGYGSKLHLISCVYAATTGNQANVEDGLYINMSTTNTSTYTHANSRALVITQYSNCTTTQAAMSGLVVVGGCLNSGVVTTLNLINVAPSNGALGGTVTNINGLLISNLAASGAPTTIAGINIAASATAVGTTKYGIFIGNQSGATSNFSIFCGTGQWSSDGVYATTVGATNRDVYVDNTGLIGYVSSSKRYKTNISDIEDTSWIYKLRPVTFDYIDKEMGLHKMGLIAEEVMEINKEIVSFTQIVEYDKEEEVKQTEITTACCDSKKITITDEPETVNYTQLITPMLAEIQNLNRRLEKVENR